MNRPRHVPAQRWDAQLLLKALHAGGDGRLRHEQAFGGGDQAAATHDFQKGTGLIDVHELLGG